MKLDTLLRLYNDLVRLTQDQPAVVQYSRGYGIVFRQLGKVMAIPYFRNYYFKGKLKLGVLTPDDLALLLKNIKKLIEDQSFIEGELGMCMGKFKTSFYKLYLASNLDEPQLVSELNFISIRRKFLSRIYLRRYSPESRTLLKAIIHEERSRKSNKSIAKPTTPEV